MNALTQVKPQRVEDSEAYDDLCELFIHGEMEASEFSRRVKELKDELGLSNTSR